MYFGPSSLTTDTLILDQKVTAPGVVDADDVIYIAGNADDEITQVYAVEKVKHSETAARFSYSLATKFNHEIGLDTDSNRASPVLANAKSTQDGTPGQIVIFGLDGVASTGQDDSKILALQTNHTRYATSSRKLRHGWAFPDDDYYTDYDYSDVGQIYGSGALDGEGYLYWGAAAREADDSLASSTDVLGYNQILVLNVADGTPVDQGQSSESWGSTTAPGYMLAHGVFTTPLVLGDYLFVVAGGHLYRLTRSVSGVLGGEESYDLLSNCDAPTDYATHAAYDSNEAPANSPIPGANGTVVVAFANCVFNFDMETLEVNWQYISDSTTDVFWNSPCQDHNDITYAAHIQGGVVGLKSTASGKLNARGDYYAPELAFSEISLGEKFKATPICLGGGNKQQVMHIIGNKGTMFGISSAGGTVIEETDMDGTNEVGVPLCHDRGGYLYFTSISAGELVKVGGARGFEGGCNAGTRNNPVLANATRYGPGGELAAGPYPCAECRAGTYSAQISVPASQENCTACPYGQYQGNERQTYCFLCEVDEWCLGGYECDYGRGGTACASCADGYYSLGDTCRECPANSSAYALPVMILIIFILVLIFRYTGANAYVTGSKFTADLKPRDIFRVEFKEKGQTIVAQSRVKTVMTDFILELEKPLGNSEPIIDAEFEVLEFREDGAGKPRKGTGKICVPGKQGGKPNPDGMATKATIFIATNFFCLKYHVDDKENQAKLYRPSKVFGQTTSGTQVLSAALVIGMTWIQMTTIFMEFELEWPTRLQWIFNLLGNIAFFNVPDLLTAPQCQWSSKYNSNWFLTIFAPLIMISSFSVVYLAARKLYKNPGTLRSIRDRCFQASLIIVIVMYVLIASKALEPLLCTRQGDGIRYMNANPDIECTILNFETKDPYTAMSIAAYVLFVVYGFGLPIYLFWALTNAKRRNLMGDMNFIQRYGWLYLRYNRDYYYWEIVMLLRKLFIVLFQMAFNNYPSKQVYACLIIIGVAFVWHCKVKPYTCYDCIKQRKKRCKHWSANDLMEGGSMFAQLIFLGFGLLNYQISQDVGRPNPVLTGLSIAVILVVVVSLGGLIGRSMLEQELEKKKLEEDGISFELEKGIGQLQNLLG